MVRARATVTEAVATQWIGAHPRTNPRDEKDAFDDVPVLIIDVDDRDERTQWTSFRNGGPVQILQISVAKRQGTGRQRRVRLAHGC